MACAAFTSHSNVTEPQMFSSGMGNVRARAGLRRFVSNFIILQTACCSHAFLSKLYLIVFDILWGCGWIIRLNSFRRRRRRRNKIYFVRVNLRVSLTRLKYLIFPYIVKLTIYMINGAMTR